VRHLGCHADADSLLNLCAGRLVLAPRVSVVMRMPSVRSESSAHAVKLASHRHKQICAIFMAYIYLTETGNIFRFHVT